MKNFKWYYVREFLLKFGFIGRLVVKGIIFTWLKLIIAGFIKVDKNHPILQTVIEIDPFVHKIGCIDRFFGKKGLYQPLLTKAIRLTPC
ncbi:MAG: hypothetical protein KBB86_00080 [Candidatus Pacebacteria bacterium]|nr:hypothetical protein [Candidatus Paceibacterota bacterium]